MNSSMKPAIHLGPNFKHKIRRYWECVQHYSKVAERTFWHAWSIHHLPGWDRYQPMIKRANGRRQKYVSTLIPFNVLGRWKTLLKVKWKDSSCIRLTKMQLVSMEKQLNSSGKNPRIFNIFYSWQIQEDLETWRIQQEEFTDRIIFMSMFNDIVWNTNDENCGSNDEKVKNYAKRFSEGHWTFLGRGSEEKWYGSSNHAQKRAMELHRSSCISKVSVP